MWTKLSILLSNCPHFLRINFTAHVKNVHRKHCSRDCLVFKQASNWMKIAWPLQENIDISVHTLMQIVNNFLTDLNVKLNIFLVHNTFIEYISIHSFIHIHSNKHPHLFKYCLITKSGNDYTTHLLNLIP